VNPSQSTPRSATPSADRPISLLEVQDFGLEFRTRSGTVHALEHVSFSIGKGETVGLVGESGSGKSVLSYAVLGISDRAAKVTSGQAKFAGLDLLKASEDELAAVRGREISMIFQNPRTALNPIRKVGKQIEDVLKRHVPATAGANRNQDWHAQAVAALRAVNIPDPERRYNAYPFELSGGMCQRIMIALALACEPSLLIADEPTTGLDVTTQAAIMDSIVALSKARGMATLFITHDLALAADYCDRIIVMHAGQIVEAADAKTLFSAPRHPYAAQLVASSPKAGSTIETLSAIPGSLPDLRRNDLPRCRFKERCTRATVLCEEWMPVNARAGAHAAACVHPQDEAALV
jgi:peptide/nickel transport system ATP-binding protein